MKITKPTFLVDKEKCLRNIERMIQKAVASGSALRPHFKTHHSAKIGNWFREFGLKSCTVSSVSMGQYFAVNGWNDITIAFPFNPLESKEISTLASQAKLNILIESMDSLQLANELIKGSVGYFIKIDVGTKRTGIEPDKIDLIQKIVEGSNEKIEFKGFLSHAGHTYSSSLDDIKNIYSNAVSILNDLKSRFGGIISYGDTPSCSLINDFSEIDEIRAGNFLFYDWMQKEIGSCNMDDIAVCVACPVVAIHSERNEAVIYGGGVHLSKDFVGENGQKCFGKVVKLEDDCWGTEIIGSVGKLSQEHGTIKMPSKELASLRVGDLIGVIPVHSCLAADLQGHYYTTNGDKIQKILKD